MQNFLEMEPFDEAMYKGHLRRPLGADKRAYYDALQLCI